jgi:hypothetical protein
VSYVWPLSLNEARWWTSRARPTDRSITSHPDPSSTSTSLMEWPTPHCIIKQSWSQYTAMMRRRLLDMERGTENCRRLQQNAARRGNRVEWRQSRTEHALEGRGNYLCRQKGTWDRTTARGPRGTSHAGLPFSPHGSFC